MHWLFINWYIVVAILSAFLLGWGIGIWYGTSRAYAAAAEQQRQQDALRTWENYLKQFQGGTNGK